MAEQLPEVIDLNVGGMHVTTMRSTLTKYPGSMLATMFSGRHVISQDKDGRYVIDCDGKIFNHILEFLRFGTLPPFEVAEAVYKYSEYFQLIELSKSLCKFQPVNYLLQISNLKDRNATYSQFANKVIESLECVAKKNDNIVISVAQENCPHDLISDVIQELRAKIHPLACLEISDTYLDLMKHSEKEEILFLTADQLKTLGYGSNIFYYIGRDFSSSIILICNENAIPKLRTIDGVRFRSLLNDSR